MAVLLTGVGLVGCGGSSGSSADTTAVQQTVTKVLHGLGSGDGATVCSLATKDGQAALAKAIPHSTCPQVVDLVSAHLSSAQKQGLQNAKVGKVKIDGNHASVSDSAITTTKGTLKGFLEGTPTKLTKQSDGSWKISG